MKGWKERREQGSVGWMEGRRGRERKREYGRRRRNGYPRRLNARNQIIKERKLVI